MNDYATVLATLDTLERSWFPSLSSHYRPSPGMPTLSPPGIAPGSGTLMNGEVQFLSIEYVRWGEPPPKKCHATIHDAFEPNVPSLTSPVPVIAAIGINYGQAVPCHPFPTHHLQRVSGKRTWVEDYSWPPTRNALNAVLPHYFTRHADIKSRGRASFAPARFPDSDYILICTNFSPFLSQRTWSGYPKATKAAILAAWDPKLHLHDLIRVLGDSIDLWVAHGKEEVWPHFNRDGVPGRWVMTPNLSSMSIPRMGSYWINLPEVWP